MTSCATLLAMPVGLWTQVLHLVPLRSLRPHRPRQKTNACVLPATSEQVGTAAGGSGGQASQRGAAFLPEETSLFSRDKFVLRKTRR
jgi:hypothetical protein